MHIIYPITFYKVEGCWKVVYAFSKDKKKINLHLRFSSYSVYFKDIPKDFYFASK